jgi:hypothetical protein
MKAPSRQWHVVAFLSLGWEPTAAIMSYPEIMATIALAISLGSLAFTIWSYWIKGRKEWRATLPVVDVQITPHRNRIYRLRLTVRNLRPHEVAVRNVRLKRPRSAYFRRSAYPSEKVFTQHFTRSWTWGFDAIAPGATQTYTGFIDLSEMPPPICVVLGIDLVLSGSYEQPRSSTIRRMVSD